MIDLIAYEQGELNAEEERALFQKLVDNGMAWTLQGHYGRVAATMLRSGQIKPTTNIAKKIARGASERAAEL